MKGILLGIGITALGWATVAAMTAQWRGGKTTISLLLCAAVAAWLMRATDTPRS